MRISWIFFLIMNWICSGSNSYALVNRNRPPVFTMEPISTIALKGRPITLNCNVDGNPPPQVQWRRNGKPVPSPADTRRLRLPSGSLHITKVINNRRNKPDVGVYQCIATNQVGTTVSRKVKLSVAVLSKKFQEHPQNETAVEGTTARFSCKTRKAIPDPTVTWEKDGTPIDSANKRFVTLPQGILQISDVKMSDEGRYRCVAQNMAKTRRSNYARLTVKRVAKGKVIWFNFTVPPSNTTSVTGETAIMECVTTGKPLPVVRWTKLGNRHKLQDVSRGTPSGISNLRIMDVTDKDSGQYECVATAAGKTIISSAWLFVKEPPHFTSRPDTEILGREGSSVRMLCSARGSPYPKITWLKNGRVLHYNSRISFFRGAKELRIEQTVVSDSGVYQCFAENDVGNIQVSSRIRIQRSVLRPPAPNNLEITATSPTSLHLTWKRPVFSFAIPHYSIHCMPSGGPRVLERLARDNSTNFYIFRGLKANTEYACSVISYSRKAVGFRSKVVKVKTLEDAPTGAPKKIAVTSETPDSLDVSWNPPDKSTQNGVIINYLIRYVKDSQSEVRTVYVPGNDHMVTINKLDKGLTYAVQVAAQTSGGIGPFSKSIDGTVLVTPNEVISAPLFDRPMLNSSVVRVMWSVPLYGAHKVVEYRLYYKKISGAQQGPVTINKQKKEYILNKLDPTTQYTLKLQAWDGKQAGKTATIVVKTTSEKALPQTSTPPPPPPNIHCKADSSTSLHVTWDEPRKDIASYTVKYEIKGNKDKSVIKTQDTYFKRIQLMGLTPGKEYTVTVQSHRSIKRATPGQFSKAANGCITHEAEPSSPPLNVKFQYVTTILVDLIWLPPKQPNGRLTKYKILYSVNKTQDDKYWKSKVVLPVTEIFRRKFETARLSGLEPNVTYYVKIFACNNIGYGPPSEPITVKVAQENLIESDDSWTVPTRTTTTTTTTKTTSHSPNGMVEHKEQTTNEEFAVKLGIIIGCVITAFFIVILALFIVWRNPCRRYAYPHQPKQEMESLNKVLHISHPENLPLNHCNGTSQVPTANGKVFTTNGSAHPGSISSYNINTNGSISSQLDRGVNKMVPFEVQSDGRQYSVVVIERRINSNSLSADV